MWSTTAIFIRYLTVTYRLPALALAFWRDLFVFLALAVAFTAVNRARLRVERRRLPFLVGHGFVLAVFNALWVASVVLNGAAVSTVLAYSSAAFTAVLGWRLLGERLSPAKALAVALSVAGCVLVSGAYTPVAWRVNAGGIVVGVLTGLAFAAYSLMGRAASQSGLDSWTSLLYTFGFASAFLLASNWIAGWWAGHDPAAELFWLQGAVIGWVVLLSLAIGPTVGGFGLYTLSLSYLPASVANIVATLEPVFTAALAYLLLGERLTSPQLLGGALVIAGVVILRLRDR